jgi:RNA polymerase-binding transcription factor DksA
VKVKSNVKTATKAQGKKTTAKAVIKKSPLRSAKSAATTPKKGLMSTAAKKTAAKKAAPKKVQAKKVAPKKVAPKKVAPKKVEAKKVVAKKPVAVKAAKAAPAKKVVAKEVVKAAPAKVPAKAPETKVVAIPAPSKGAPAKAIVLSRGNGPVRSRSRKPSERATPKLEPRVKKDTSKNEAMFERTQSAPTISAPKITEFLSTPSYTTPEPVKPKPNVRYSDKDLKVFRALIESEKEKTLDELRMLKERLEDLTNYEASEETAVYSMHMAEQGSEAVEREKTYAQIQRTTDYLRKLDEAMIRIEEKTYGICRQCGILIARERLMAVPITTLSASWKLRQQCPTDGIDKVGR